MKTETTRKLEQLLANRFNKRNDFYVFECTIGWYGKEIVDCIMYNCQRETYCYEIKQSKQDFHSKNKLTFIGNKNYFVMPYKLYQEEKDKQFELLRSSIPVQKIKNKIEELKNEKEQLRIDNNVLWDSGIYKLDIKLTALQELLEGED